jgi:hypothetical protein
MGGDHEVFPREITSVMSAEIPQNERESFSLERSDDEDSINNSSNSNEDDDEDDDDEDEEAVAASESSPALLPLGNDDVVLPDVISSSAHINYYPQPPLPRSQRRKYSSIGSRREEKMIANFTCGICCRLLFRAQVMRPCGHNVFCEECAPPLDARESACSECFVPFEAAQPFRSADNIADGMVRQAGFLKDEAADEWRTRGAEYAAARSAERG